MKTALTSCLLLTFGMALPAPPAQFEWHPNYEDALRTAASEQRVVFVALDHAGEGRCDYFLKKLTKDKRVLALSRESLNVPATFETHKTSGGCPRFKGVKCEDHRNAAVSLRDSVLRRNDEGMLAFPQYLWLDGQGRLLLSVAFEIDRDGLLWCFGAAQRMVNPETAAPLAPEARPPRRLLMGRAFELAPGDDRGRGMTADELEEALSSMRRSFLGMSNRRRIGSVMFTDEKDAVDYVRIQLKNVLRAYVPDRVAPTIRTIGLISPVAFWKALEEFQDPKDPVVRHEVAVALEQMGASDAMRMAKGALRREKDDEVIKGAWVRALGACGASDKNTRKYLLGLAGDDHSELTRANAAFALGYLRRHEEVRARWQELLAGNSQTLRVAAACGAALARDETCIPFLETAIDEADEEDRPPLERALAVLRGGDLYPLADDVSQITRDDIPRDRIFFGGPRAPSEEGDDEDEDDEESGR